MYVEAERKKNLKVKFGLKKPINSTNTTSNIGKFPLTHKASTFGVAIGMTGRATTLLKKPSIFNEQDDDEDEEMDRDAGVKASDGNTADSTGFKPNKGMKVCFRVLAKLYESFQVMTYEYYVKFYTSLDTRKQICF